MRSAVDAEADAGVDLDAVRPVLELYFRALAGHRVTLLAQADPGDPRQYPDTPTTVRLPGRVAYHPDAAGNLGWYRACLTHRAAHEAAGTFRFSLARDGALFARLRPAAPDAVDRFDPETDLEAFLRLFAFRNLAVEVFTACEDRRVEAFAARRFPGAAPAVARAAARALGQRPHLDALPPRTALAEILVRLSLGATGPLRVPRLLHEPVARLRRVVDRLGDPAATVEDAAEAALRAYTLITRLPNLRADYGPPVPVDPSRPPSDPPDWPTGWPEPRRVRLEGDAILETPVVPVDYRDALGSRHTRYRPAGPLDQEAIYRVVPLPAGGDGDGRVDADDDPDGRGGEDRPPGPPQPLPHPPHDHGGDDDHHEAAGGHLHPDGPDTFVYPEWDHVAGRYRRDWCRVREQRLPTDGGLAFHRRTVHAYRRLVPGLRAQLEQFAPEGPRRLGRQTDGDELDLGAAIDALVDLRAGNPPSDRLYRRSVRAERDVAVLFLIDLSSSTAERIEGDADAPGIAEAIHGTRYRRIIDVEKETVALLMTALEAIGDRYGVYGFSGTGRDDVRVPVLKSLREPLVAAAARVPGLKPIHTTRMGTAVRHATARLRQASARTRLLVLVSDGRPFDLDYGQDHGEGAEVAYALADTRRALEEARDGGVRPLVLTVDERGEDYLADMGGGIPYQVIADTAQLPLRLLAAYRHLSR